MQDSSEILARRNVHLQGSFLEKKLECYPCKVFVWKNILLQDTCREKPIHPKGLERKILVCKVLAEQNILLHNLPNQKRVFRSRKKFSTTYAIVLFFFSRPFHENFKFPKNSPYDFHEILHSHSTPKGAPACAKALKSYGWDVRNTVKISPKMAKKQRFFDFFRFSQKLSIRFERNFLQLFYTILESYMCNGIKIVWLECEKHSQN